MQLNDSHMIEQTLGTTVPEVEVMYWLAEDAHYKGNSSLAKSMLVLLLYLVKYKPDLIKSGLRSPHKKRVQIMIQELFNNKSPKEREPITIKPAIEAMKIPFKSEQELKDYLIKHTNVLSEALKESVKIHGVEVVVEED